MIGYDEEDGLFGEFIFGDRGFTSPGFEGELWKHYWQNSDYAVSTYGRVWSCKRNIFLKPGKTDRYGHLAIGMCYHGIMTNVYVHRMVAEMFIPNPDNLPVVRHLDGNPANNVVWNLAWGTAKDNWEDAVRHGTAHFLSDEELEKAREKGSEKARAVCSQPVIATSKFNGSQILFSSQHDAARQLNLNVCHINDCLAGRLNHTGGYTFIRAEPERSEF